jgi:pyruvate dehydrogenase E1 component beta subunit
MHKEEKKTSFLDAINQAQIEEMQRDDRVFLIGEDISIYGGTSIVKSIEEKRVMNMPISELGFTGMGVGAAMAGMRPIVDLTISSFVYLASDPIINQAAKQRYMTGGLMQVPIVFRACMYYNVGNSAQHSDRPYPTFMNSPGLKIVVPSTPADAKGLMKAAIRDDDPVLFFEDINLWSQKAIVSDDKDFVIPIGVAEVKRQGTDVTIISIGACLSKALAASEQLSSEGISVEVLDPRTLVPLDKKAILESVRKTGRLVIVENAHRTNGVAAEIAAVISEEGFESLLKPIQRVATPDVNIPASPALEKSLYPSVEAVVAAVRKII